jgi:hypothetical protein
MSTRKATTETLEYRAALLEQLPVGTTIRTVTTHVSQSGMMRVIRPLVLKDSSAIDLSWSIDHADFGYRLHRRHQGIVVNGAGMDMGFALVYGISRSLYPNGHACTGDSKCPSNDHTNEWREPNYSLDRIHSDGGYALNHSWL